jgi:hypothetical protein
MNKHFVKERSAKIVILLSVVMEQLADFLRLYFTDRDLEDLKKKPKGFDSPSPYSRGQSSNPHSAHLSHATLLQFYCHALCVHMLTGTLQGRTDQRPEPKPCKEPCHRSDRTARQQNCPKLFNITASYMSSPHIPLLEPKLSYKAIM